MTENRKLLDLIEQHERNSASKAETIVGDHKYGTQDNFVACQERGLITHMGDASKGQDHHQAKGIFPKSAFRYAASSDTYRGPAGELLKPRRVHPIRHTMEYKARSGACAVCLLRSQCTRAKTGPTLHRHEKQAALDLARSQTHSRAARAGSAGAGNNSWKRVLPTPPTIITSSERAGEGFGASKSRDYLIAAIQNVPILLANGGGKRSAVANIVAANIQKIEGRPHYKRFLSEGEPQCLSAATNALFLSFLRSNLRSFLDFTFA